MMARTQGKYTFAILHTHAGFVRLIHFYMFARLRLSLPLRRLISPPSYFLGLWHYLILPSTSLSRQHLISPPCFLGSWHYLILPSTSLSSSRQHFISPPSCFLGSWHYLILPSTSLSSSGILHHDALAMRSKCMLLQWQLSQFVWLLKRK